jgi:hypothetical protein
LEGVLNAAPATPEAIVRRADHGLVAAFVKAPGKMQTHAKRRSHARAQLACGDRRFRIERARVRGAVMDTSLLATGGATGEPNGVVTPLPQ